MLNPGLSGLNVITGSLESEAPWLQWESEAAVLRVSPDAVDADVQAAPSRAGKVEEGRGPGPRGLQTVEAAGNSLQHLESAQPCRRCSVGPGRLTGPRTYQIVRTYICVALSH